MMATFLMFIAGNEVYHNLSLKAKIIVRVYFKLPMTTPYKIARIYWKRAGLKEMFYIYVLRSKTDDKLYVGFCNDLKRRFNEHNSGKVRSTESRVPFEIVYNEACLSENQAIKREKYFKTGFGRNFLKS